jgi:hypothetical protein
MTTPHAITRVAITIADLYGGSFVPAPLPRAAVVFERLAGAIGPGDVGNEIMTFPSWYESRDPID